MFSSLCRLISLFEFLLSFEFLFEFTFGFEVGFNNNNNVENVCPSVCLLLVCLSLVLFVCLSPVRHCVLIVVNEWLEWNGEKQQKQQHLQRSLFTVSVDAQLIWPRCVMIVRRCSSSNNYNNFEHCSCCTLIHWLELCLRTWNAGASRSENSTWRVRTVKLLFASSNGECFCFEQQQQGSQLSELQSDNLASVSCSVQWNDCVTGQRQPLTHSE